MKKALFFVFITLMGYCGQTQASPYFQKYNAICKNIYENDKTLCKTILAKENIDPKYEAYKAIIERAKLYNCEKSPLRDYHTKEIQNAIKHTNSENLEAVKYALTNIYNLGTLISYLKENDFETIPKTKQDYIVDLLGIQFNDKFSYQQAKTLAGIIKNSDDDTVEWLTWIDGELSDSLYLIQKMIEKGIFEDFAHTTLAFDEKYQKEMSENMPLKYRAYMYMLFEKSYKNDNEAQEEEQIESEEDEDFIKSVYYNEITKIPSINEGDYYIKINDKFYDYVTDVSPDEIKSEDKITFIKKTEFPDREYYFKALELFDKYNLKEDVHLKLFYNDLTNLDNIEEDVQTGIYQEFYKNYYYGEFAHRKPEEYYFYRLLKKQNMFSYRDIIHIMEKPQPCHTFLKKYSKDNKTKVENVLKDSKLTNEEKINKILNVTSYRHATPKETLARIFYKFPRIRRMFVYDEELIEEPIPFIWK